MVADHDHQATMTYFPDTLRRPVPLAFRDAAADVRDVLWGRPVFKAPRLEAVRGLVPLPRVDDRPTFTARPRPRA